MFCLALLSIILGLSLTSVTFRIARTQQLLTSQKEAGPHKILTL